MKQHDKRRTWRNATLEKTIALAMAFAWAGTVNAQPMNDSQVTVAVEQELMRDDAVPYNRVDVLTTDGIVTLTGHVTNLAARLQAERRAAIVRGVRGVINRIDVTAASPPAPELVGSIEEALEADPATDAYEVMVTANDEGHVSLAGTVDSRAERDLVEAVVMTVPGVSAIDDRLNLGPPVTFAHQSDLGAQIAALLEWDVRVDDSLISVRALEGSRVLLSGTVGSYAEKDLAERLAWLPGVQSVDVDHLTVEPWARDEDVQLGERSSPADNEIETALHRVLELDPRVRSAPIEVIVEDGTAWLRGRVDNLLAKRAATRDAFNTLGVVKVRNHLKVRSTGASDEEVRRSIRTALEGAGVLEHGHVEIRVDDGEVRLIGDVGSSADYRRIDRIASIAPGVEELFNDVTVNGAAPAAASYSYFAGMYRAAAFPSESDREIYDDVRSELFWSPFVDAEQVLIEVDDGVVTLTGAVSSLREKRIAAENAYEGGALAVRNELTTPSDAREDSRG